MFRQKLRAQLRLASVTWKPYDAKRKQMKLTGVR